MASQFRAGRDVILRTGQWEAARDYYGRVLGWPVAYEDERLVGFEAGALRLYVEKGPAQGPVFEWLVEDVAAARDRLLAAGCTLVEEDPALPRCYLRDPYGVVFNLGRA
jgi:catechol 2,3-dioxygenase-like lactoylglutathione lyase family enzyme